MSARGKSLFKAIENHPNDSRVKFREDDTVQTLSSRMGTGGVTYRWFSKKKEVIQWMM